MRTNKKLLPLVLLACASLLPIGFGKLAASDAQPQNSGEILTVDVDGSLDFASQVLKVDIGTE